MHNEYIYKQQKNKMSALLKSNEKKYYQNLIMENQQCLRKTWNVIKQVINKKKSSRKCNEFHSGGNILNDTTEISNKFNNYFINIGPTLASQIPDTGTNYKKFLPNNNTNSIFLSPVNHDEIKNNILNLNNSAPGWDEITAKMLKLVGDKLSLPLTHLINLSFQEGFFFPEELNLPRSRHYIKPMIQCTSTIIDLFPYLQYILKNLRN